MTISRAASQIVRSRAQLEASALRLLRNAVAYGCGDEEAINFAVDAMGKENAGIVARVWARHFTTTEPI